MTSTTRGWRLPRVGWHRCVLALFQLALPPAISGKPGGQQGDLTGTAVSPH
jgi:hypothetical protein